MIASMGEISIWRAYGRALGGGVFGLALVLVSMISFGVGSFEAALTLVPLSGVFLWPHNASSSLSIVLIFCLGILVDILSNGPFGMWALLYLITYGVLRPDLRSRALSMQRLWFRFIVWVLLIDAVLVLLGVITIDGRTAIWPLIFQTLMAILIFPLVQGLVQLSRWMSQRDQSDRYPA
jgi:cell shape-determining protein MreD